MNNDATNKTDRPRPEDDARISAFIDGQLEANERAEFEALLRADPAYQVAVEKMRRVSRSIQSLPRIELGDGFTKRVMQQAAEAKSSANATGLKAATAADATSTREESVVPQVANRTNRTPWRTLVYAAATLAAALLFVFLSPRLWPFGNPPGEFAHTDPSSDPAPMGIDERESVDAAKAKNLDAVAQQDLAESDFDRNKDGLGSGVASGSNEGADKFNFFAEDSKAKLDAFENRRPRTDYGIAGTSDEFSLERKTASPGDPLGDLNRLDEVPAVRSIAAPAAPPNNALANSTADGSASADFVQESVSNGSERGAQVPLGSIAKPSSVKPPSVEALSASPNNRSLQVESSKWDYSGQAAQHLKFVNSLGLKTDSLSLFGLSEGEDGLSRYKQTRRMARIGKRLAKERIAVVSLSNQLATNDFFEKASANGIQVRYAEATSGMATGLSAGAIISPPARKKSPASAAAEFGGVRGGGFGGGGFGGGVANTPPAQEINASGGRGIELESTDRAVRSQGRNSRRRGAIAGNDGDLELRFEKERVQIESKKAKERAAGAPPTARALAQGAPGSPSAAEATVRLAMPERDEAERQLAETEKVRAADQALGFAIVLSDTTSLTLQSPESPPATAGPVTLAQQDDVGTGSSPEETLEENLEILKSANDGAIFDPKKTEKSSSLAEASPKPAPQVTARTLDDLRGRYATGSSGTQQRGREFEELESATSQPKGRYVLVEATPEVMKKFVVSLSPSRGDQWYYYESNGGTRWTFDEVRVPPVSNDSEGRLSELQPKKAKTVDGSNDQENPFDDDDATANLSDGEALVESMTRSEPSEPSEPSQPIERAPELFDDQLEQQVDQQGLFGEAEGYVRPSLERRSIDRSQAAEVTSGKDESLQKTFASPEAKETSRSESKDPPLVRVLFFLPESKQP